MSECWLWRGAKLKSGYGTVWNQRRKMLAHRLAWESENGPIPKGMYVLHKCDRPSCVRPDHLFLGTQTDNMQDCASKGRQPGSNGKMRGENSPNAKLTWDKAREIRRRRANESAPSLAREFGVSHRVIYLIERGEAWRESA